MLLFFKLAMSPVFCVTKLWIDMYLSFCNPIKADVNADKLRAIETQNYRLLMRLRSIHKNYSLYSPKKHMYLLRGEACRWATGLSLPHSRLPVFFQVLISQKGFTVLCCIRDLHARFLDDCSRSTKPPRKPRKITELASNSNDACRSLISHNCKEISEDMCHRVAALSLHGDSSPLK
jgi:hypothetical protein